jgi:hypothetical protein
MSKEEPEQASVASGVRNGRRKNLVLGGILLGVMLAEGLTVFILVKRFGPQPSSAQAGVVGLDGTEGQAAPEEAEVEVTQFRAQNKKAQQIVVYDLAVYATVAKPDQEKLQSLVRNRQATIQDRFSSIVRAADPQVMMEADPATLRQRFHQELSEIVGEDVQIKEVLIPSIVAYREE